MVGQRDRTTEVAEGRGEIHKIIPRPRATRFMNSFLYPRFSSFASSFSASLRTPRFSLHFFISVVSVSSVASFVLIGRALKTMRR
jgi:hypothetical protein